MSAHSSPFSNVHPTLREPAFLGFDAPARCEAEVFDCFIEGKVPHQIDGTFYRVAPDVQVLPKYPGEVNFNGDGMVSAFRFRNGHVDFKNKFVRTEKLVRERRARHALVGKYRNGYTDDPLIANAIRTTSNTNIVHMYGKLLALKEDALPYEMDPHTLRTVGITNFDGQYTAPTFTAHPKNDPRTGETVIYGYEAKGDGTKDVAYFLFDKDGKKVEEFWFEAPYCGVMHDIGITENYIVFQIYPLQCDIDRVKRGGNHWVYDEELPMYLCLLPKRNPKPEDVQWFHWDKDYFEGHFSNAFERNGKVYADFPVIKGNVMSWFPNKDGWAPPRPSLKTFFARFELDPRTTNLRLPDPEKICDVSGEFSRIDDRFTGQEYTYTFLAAINMAFKYDPVKSGGRPFPGFNCIGRINNKTGQVDYWSPGPTASVGEPSFIPRSADAPEGDGFVICLINRFDTQLSDLVILDTSDFKEVAMVKLPLRVRPGLHGNFVERSSMVDPDRELGDFEWVPAKFDGPVADEISGAKIPNRGARTPMSGFTTDGGVMGHPKSGTSSLQRANGVNGHHASSSMQEEVVNESMARDA